MLPRDSFPAAPNVALTARGSFPTVALTIPRTPDTTPETRARLDNRHFRPVSNPAAAFDLKIKHALLDLDPKHFALLQIDTDNAGLKVVNFARSLGCRDHAASRP